MSNVTDATRKPTAVQRFRKRPIEIEAIQLTPENERNVVRFVREGISPEDLERELAYDMPMMIDTLEGTAVVSPGDWVIRGVKGEYYPCKPDVFEATYEPVCKFVGQMFPCEFWATVAVSRGGVATLVSELPNDFDFVFDGDHLDDNGVEGVPVNAGLWLCRIRCDIKYDEPQLTVMEFERTTHVIQQVGFTPCQ